MSLLLAGLLALVGCAPGAYGSTRPLIKIGLAAPFEGLGRPLGYEALQGVKLALAHRNAAGGVGGAMVELVALNDANRPDEARLQARELAADPAVLGVVTGWSGGIAAAALPVYRQEGLAVVVPWSVPPQLADPAAGLVLVAADSARIARVLAGRLTAEESREVAVTGDAQAVAPYLDVLGERAGAVPLPEGPGREVLREWVARLVLARPPPPRALILAAEGASAGGIVQALAETSWSGTLLGSADAGSTSLVDVAGEAAAGLIFASPAPAGKDLAQAIEGRAGLPLEELAPRAVLAYDATNVLLSAIETATRTEGKPTRAGVVAAMGAVRVQGLTGDIAFAEDGRRPEAPVWLYRIEANGYPGELVE